MAKEYKDILYEVRNGVVRITINRPDVYNAFRNQTLEELIDALHAADPDWVIFDLPKRRMRSRLTSDARSVRGGRARVNALSHVY